MFTFGRSNERRSDNMILRSLVLIAFVFSAGSSVVFYLRLRIKHNDVWKSLGCPSYFSFPLGKRMAAYRSFIFSQAVSDLRDPWLLWLSKTMSVAGAITFALFVVAMVLRWRY
jgi:hypothetical protein